MRLIRHALFGWPSLQLRDDTAAQLRAMSVEELSAAITALLAEATAPGENMTEDQADRYEQLEAELLLRRRAGQVQARAKALVGAGIGAGVHVAEAKPDETLTRAFMDYVRTGRDNDDLRNEMAVRAQETGTASEGGYLVPEGFRDKIVERMKRFGGIGEHVENISTTDGRTLPWPTVDDTANSGEVVAEEATIAAGADVVFGEADLGAYSFMAGGAGNLPLRVSWELLQDSAIDIEALLARLLGKRIGRAMAVKRITGTGTNEPTGIITGKTPVETAGTTGITYADLLTWMHSVDPDYRDNAKWAFSDASMAVIEGLLDENGRPLFMPGSGNVGDSPSAGKLLGFPVVIDQGFATFDPDNAAVEFGVFGDLEAGYVWRTVKDFTLIVDPYARKANRQNEYICWARADGTPQDLNAYITMAGNTP